MATKGAHVFRINIADYAREWLQELRIMQYQPLLYTLNFDYDTLNEPVDEASPPEAFISELDEPEPQESVKRLPTASWELVQKLSQQLAVTVSGSNAKKPLNFSKCLEDVYMRSSFSSNHQVASSKIIFPRSLVNIASKHRTPWSHPPAGCLIRRVEVALRRLRMPG